MSSVSRDSNPTEFAYIRQSKWKEIIAIKTERTQIHFLSDVFVTIASLDKLPNKKVVCGHPLTQL